MRKQWDTLVAIVTLQMIRDVLAGSMFLFVDKTRRRVKLLWFDGTGVCAGQADHELTTARRARTGYGVTTASSMPESIIEPHKHSPNPVPAALQVEAPLAPVLQVQPESTEPGKHLGVLSQAMTTINAAT